MENMKTGPFLGCFPTRKSGYGKKKYIPKKYEFRNFATEIYCQT